MKPLEITNIERAEKVLSGKLIHESSEDELKTKLKVIYTMVGLRPQHFPEDEEKAFLHTYIYQKYANKTLNELVLAFDLAIQGQLNIEDVKVYDQFSCEYLAKIMNGYREWLKIVHHNKFTHKSPDAIEEKKELTDVEWDEWIEDIKTYNVDLIPISCYEYLIRKEKISPTNEIKKEHFQKAIITLTAKLATDIKDVRTYNEFVAMKNTGKWEGKFYDSLVVISKRTIVKSYFDSLNV